MRTKVIVAILLATLGAIAFSEVIELQGTVTAIDVDARIISVVSESKEGPKTLALEVIRKAGELSSVKAGDNIVLTYDRDLEVVTKIGAGPEDLHSKRSISTSEVLGQSRGGGARPASSELTEDQAKELIKNHWFVSLGPHETELTDGAAKVLAGYSGKVLRLTELTTITAHQASLLAGHTPTRSDGHNDDLSSSLTLNGLKSITPEVAKALAKHKGYLELEGVAAMTPEVASGFASHRGSLILGVSTLTRETAKALASHHGKLYLSRINAIEPGVAEELSKHLGTMLCFNSMKDLSVEAAAALAHYRGELVFSAIKSLSDECVETLAKHKGVLNLRGLTQLSDVQAASLAHHLGDLDLEQIAALSDTQAIALAKHVGELRLSGLKALSEKATAAFKHHIGPVTIGTGRLGVPLDMVTSRDSNAAGAPTQQQPSNRPLAEAPEAAGTTVAQAPPDSVTAEVTAIPVTVGPDGSQHLGFGQPSLVRELGVTAKPGLPSASGEPMGLVVCEVLVRHSGANLPELRVGDILINEGGRKILRSVSQLEDYVKECLRENKPMPLTIKRHRGAPLAATSFREDRSLESLQHLPPDKVSYSADCLRQIASKTHDGLRRAMQAAAEAAAAKARADALKPQYQTVSLREVANDPSLFIGKHICFEGVCVYPDVARDRERKLGVFAVEEKDCQTRRTIVKDELAIVGTEEFCRSVDAPLIQSRDNWFAYLGSGVPGVRRGDKPAVVPRLRVNITRGANGEILGLIDSMEVASPFPEPRGTTTTYSR